MSSRMPRRSSVRPSRSMGQGGHLVQMRRPKAIVFDILGTASKSGFLEKILFPFLNTNLEHYITSHWNQKDFIKVHQRIVDHSQELNQQDPSSPIVLAHDNEQSKATLLNFIAYVTERSLQLAGVTRLRFMVWFEGYQQSKLRTPIYKDVPDKMKRWFAEGIKFYVFSNTWVEAQKALLKNTNHGDLTNLIADHFDNDFGQLNDPSSWTRLCQQIGQTPQDVLFMTKAPLEGRAAAEAGVSVVLVLTHRHNVRAVSEEDRRHFPYVRTLNDLNWVESQLSLGANVASGAAGGSSVAGGGGGGASGAGGGSSVAAGSQSGAPTSGSATPSSSASPASGSGATSATGASSATDAGASPSSSSAAAGGGSRAGSKVSGGGGGGGSTSGHASSKVGGGGGSTSGHSTSKVGGGGGSTSGQPTSSGAASSKTGAGGGGGSSAATSQPSRSRTSQK